MLKLTGLSKSTYYRLSKVRQDKYSELKFRIVAVFEENKGRYGYRRITAQLQNEGWHINHKTVQKLMKCLGIKAKIRKVKYNSYKGEVGKVAENLLNRDFHADATKVLLLSWHEYPESYKAGESFTCTYGEIWTFTDKEILSWYNDNAKGVTDWELRLEQLIGLPESSEYTHISAFWVDIDELIRPAYQTDVTKQMSSELLDGSALGEWADWFDGNAEYSYSEDTPYPWTRLGYTYDWADNGEEYGLSEFLILPGSVIEVEWTKSTDEFIDWLEAN